MLPREIIIGRNSLVILTFKLAKQTPLIKWYMQVFNTIPFCILMIPGREISVHLLPQESNNLLGEKRLLIIC